MKKKKYLLNTRQIHMSSLLPRTTPLRPPTRTLPATPDQRFYRGYGQTQLVKEHNAVTHISFSPVAPHDFAVTSSVRVQLFGAKTRQVVRTFLRFRDTVYSAEFRPDGKLLAAGDALGLVQVFDAHNARTLLVTLQPSTHPTHVVRWNPTASQQLLAASDDRVARVFDITRPEAPVATFGGSGDYLRAAAYLPSSPLVAVGSYDGVVRLYDSRAGDQPVLSLNQGAPVESVLPLSPTTLAVAAGSGVKVWDVASASLVHTGAGFARTVTCLAQGPRGVLAGSLDGHVKVYDPEWKVVFGWKFGSGVLSCGVSPDERHVVAGLALGLTVIKTRVVEKTKNKAPTAKLSTFARMMRGAEYHGEYEHHVVGEKRKEKKLKPVERHLNAFRWGAALDAALVPGQQRESTVGVLETLRARGKMRVALAGRLEAEIEPLIHWCAKNVDDSRLVPLVADYVGVVLDMYGGLVDLAPVLEEALVGLREKVAAEAAKAREAGRINGVLQMIQRGRGAAAGA